MKWIQETYGSGGFFSLLIAVAGTAGRGPHLRSLLVILQVITYFAGPRAHATPEAGLGFSPRPQLLALRVGSFQACSASHSVKFLSLLQGLSNMTALMYPNPGLPTPGRQFSSPEDTCQQLEMFHGHDRREGLLASSGYRAGMTQNTSQPRGYPTAENCATSNVKGRWRTR